MRRSPTPTPPSPLNRSVASARFSFDVVTIGCCQMLRLVEFFDLYRGARYADALRSLEQLQLLPLALTQVDDAATRLAAVGDSVRLCLGALLLAAMRVVSELYAATKAAVARGHVGGAFVIEFLLV